MQHDIMIANRQLADVNPLVCGEHKCPSGHSFGPFAREYYLLHYVFSGDGTFQNANGHYAVGAGQIFVIRPGEWTTYTAAQETPWHYCWIGFQSTLNLSAVLEADVITAPQCAYLFQALLQSQLIHANREWYICAKIYELLAILHPQKTAQGEGTLHYVRRAQNYIEMNFEREISVAALANSVNLDRAYFSKLFKKVTGKSPQQYIVSFRLEKAAEMMVLHGVAPGEAAQLAGYHGGVNFSRMFKRKYGVAPSTYCKQQRVL